METMIKCQILGCDKTFHDTQQATLHAANSWHCITCGFSNNMELTLENIAEKCDDCAVQRNKCIRVNFKRKAYVIDGRLSVKEKGKWVHYE